MNANEVITYYGSGPKAAKAIGVTHGAVYSWRRNGIPSLRQAQIELLTGGALKRDHAATLDSGADAVKSAEAPK